MKTQKFFNVVLVFGNFDHSLSRGVIEAFLQFFFDTKLRGRELAKFVGNKKLFIIDARPKFEHLDKWWEEVFAVTMIRNI